MQTDRCSCRRRSVVAGAALLLAVVFSTLCPPVLLYNRMPSVPVGFYMRCGDDPRTGDLVAFRLPAVAHPYARRRGDSTDVLLLKPVLAVADNRVSTLHGELRLNGAFVAAIPNADAAGRPLPQHPMDRVLSDGELFVGSTRSPHSFDSRFFGPVYAAQIVGVYRRLTFGMPRNRTSEPSR